MRLVHLTDPHLTTPPDWRSLSGRSHFGKRYLGYASWARKRRFSLRRSWLDELTAQITALEPDLLLLSGDLTQIGTAEEIDQAREWLEALSGPEQICFVPGNHDTYAAESWSLLEQEWGPYLPEAGRNGFPVRKEAGDVAVLGVSTALPTLPLSATGLIGERQLERLTAALEETRSAFQVLLLHHPPLPGMIKYRKRLRDAPALARLLADQPVDLILHGHRHRNQSTDPRIYGTAPASAEAASFRVFDIDRDCDKRGADWQVEMSLWQRGAQTGGFEVTEKARWVVSAPG